MGAVFSSLLGWEGEWRSKARGETAWGYLAEEANRTWRHVPRNVAFTSRERRGESIFTCERQKVLVRNE